MSRCPCGRPRHRPSPRTPSWSRNRQATSVRGSGPQARRHPRRATWRPMTRSAARLRSISTRATRSPRPTFHMAYGLYDQAADLIRIAISREPTRRDLKLKLLEVFFVWGNKEQFLQTARELAETRANAAPGEWEKILIMGKQLAPEDPLFSGGGPSPAPRPAAWTSTSKAVRAASTSICSVSRSRATHRRGGSRHRRGRRRRGTGESTTNVTDRNAALLDNDVLRARHHRHDAPDDPARVRHARRRPARWKVRRSSSRR